ncbi:transcriptional regulator [Rhodospirillum rubrum]|uniref:RrF2 family transcriptional regulator n=1 Tax=Rhodospirillum rubrum TaxID=1085 RepID=UPI00190318E8|nr:Rrf2 family transcriptional regulator [Rhodospirillum rubrum]MBK1665516.1 transcriptional regulator [Rhodospirillum rubrum]MBK1677555.1 transcriptional regulator [Rhodospirillum rubrum]
MISQKAKYGFRALFALADAEGGQLRIEDIAERQRIPRKFLEQILLDLKHHGLVVSFRGKNGGYALRRDPKDISFTEVLRLIDGPIAPLPCLSRTAYRACEDCEGETACRMRLVFGAAYDRMLEVLETTSLGDAMNGRLGGGLSPLIDDTDTPVAPRALGA